MEKYYNKKENKYYYEGQAITRQTEGGLFSGIPSTEQLEEWGYEKQPEPKPYTPDPNAQRMAEIQSELASLDYLTDKELDGEDMAKYNEKYGGDWHAYRRKLREEYRALNATDNAETANA